MSQKLAAYPHLYSFTSTKSIVHWFQIIRTKSFQMYDDEVQAPLSSLSSISKYTKVAKFPTRNIRTPIALVYGGKDSLVDIDVMLKELPAHTVATEIQHYEHLDFLWARDVDALVFPHVYDALESFVNAGHTKEDYAKYRAARHLSLGTRLTTGGLLSSSPSYASEDERHLHVDSYAAAAAIAPGRHADALASPTPRIAGGSSPSPILSLSRRDLMHTEDDSSNTDASPTVEKHVTTVRIDGHAVRKDGAFIVDFTRKRTPSRSGSVVSFESLRNGKGINIGMARPAGGVISPGLGVGSLAGSEFDVNGGARRDKKRLKR